MTLDLSKARVETPDVDPRLTAELDAIVLADGVRLTVTDARKEEIYRVKGVDATQVMPPITAAGVKLTYVLLGILTGSIFLLFSYLVYTEHAGDAELLALYRNTMSADKVASEAVFASEIEHLTRTINAIKRDKTYAPDEAELSNASGLSNEVKLIEAMPVERRKTFIDCADLENFKQEKVDADTCLKSIADLGKDALASYSQQSMSKVSSEFLLKLNERHTSVHAFFLQVAQMLLLNLILPLLTALLGYIFGTQQASASGAQKP
jgi:hypothetical protein